MKGAVQYEKRKAGNGTCVALLTMDNAPVNALSSGVRDGLDKRLKEALADAEVKAIVVTGGHGAFCAGADISEFSSGMAGPPLPMVIDGLEASEKPIVAAIDGVSLGGGCEVALGCHWRVASSRSMAGLPEVNLGLLPGAGGTQRLPRLIGVESSIDFMCRGAPLPAAMAAKAGIYDTIAEGDNAKVVQAAVDFAAGKVGADLAARRLCNGTAKAASPDGVAAKRKEYQRMRQGELAPQAIITCIEAATDREFREGMNVEGKEFGKLLMGDQSKALQYMFFAERQCAKVPGLDAKQSGPLNAAGIVGAGLMGGGIAMCCAEAGMKVVLLDVDQKNLDRGMSVIQKNYARSVERKSKTQAQVDKILANITPSTSYDSLKDCDIVVEAVFENMDLKKKIFASFDKVCKPGCILASNTSRLDIDVIAGATSRPQDVIGCHFFSPANVMRLLENVRGPRTAPKTIATAMAFGTKLKKVTCLVGNCNGFIANRVMGVSGFGELLQGGLLPYQIDEAAEGYGMKMGPARMNDLVGLDLFGRERAKSGQANPDKFVSDAMFKLERYGQKNGKGFYKYDEKRQLSRDPEAEAIIHQVWKNIGVQPKTMSKDEIVDILYLPVVNEGFKCLEEGMAIRPSDIDTCCVFGYNWPRYRGGPMQWATSIGLPKVLEKIEKLGLKPSELLKECVNNKWKLNSKEFTARIATAWDAQWSKSKL
eukprot:gb/GFBE01004632.1/.p1 GENE.gb/GFBE01004632.1/~~gb/GFBE01004632.1/.p1  ORF type:complete len:708 (+),score=213.02 gb/GFBE01004632.1/:1-2124(+)